LAEETAVVFLCGLCYLMFVVQNCLWVGVVGNFGMEREKCLLPENLHLEMQGWNGPSFIKAN